MRARHLAARAPHPWRSMLFPRSTGRPALRTSPVSSAPLRPWLLLLPIPDPPPTTAHRPPPRPAPAFARRAQLSRSTGVARTHVPGCQALTIHTLLSAGGLARSPWPTDPPWASWFGRCPDHRLRGGTGLATGRRRGHHRASRAWRLAAQRRRQRPRARGAFSRRLRRTLGPANATTAPAHQRANMLSHLFQEQTP
jgi:hypothetical protein